MNLNLRLLLVIFSLLATASRLTDASLHAASLAWPVISTTMSESPKLGTRVLNLSDLWSQSDLDWRIETPDAEFDDGDADWIGPDHGFVLDDTAHGLVVSRPELFDHESQPRVRLILTATERHTDLSREMFRAELKATGLDQIEIDRNFGSTRRWVIEIAITDVAEEPVLVEQAYRIDTSELAQGVRLRATDPDGTTNHLWRLISDDSIVTNPEGEFRLDRNSGLLSFHSRPLTNGATATLAHSRKSRHSLSIEVMDDTGLCSVGVVQVDLLRGRIGGESNPNVAPRNSENLVRLTTISLLVDNIPPESEVASNSVNSTSGSPAIRSADMQLVKPRTQTTNTAAPSSIASVQPSAPAVDSFNEHLNSNSADQTNRHPPLSSTDPRTNVGSRDDGFNSVAAVPAVTTDSVAEVPADASETAAGSSLWLPPGVLEWVVAVLLVFVSIAGMVLWHRHQADAEAAKLAAERELHKARAMRRVDDAHGRTELELLLDQIQQVHERR